MTLDSLTKQAVNHTLHCLLGCSIGEILGMVISTAAKWSNLASIFISIVLAFFFGYLLTFQSVYRREKQAKQAVKIALATDTVSITSMEAVDSIFILLVPGAISATLSSGLFWWSLLVSLLVAFFITVPVNRFVMARGIGHSGHQH
jgi:putative flippase GtrA